MHSVNNFSENILAFFRSLVVRFVTILYFRRIVTCGEKKLPENSNVILLCNHRNGAIDGFIVKQLFPSARFFVGKNLTDSFFLRFFFGGQIDIYRAPKNEKERLFNRGQMQQACLDAGAGRPIVMFPEGTSKLGPSLLHLKKGIYYLCRDMAQSCRNSRHILLIYIGLHYERAWAFRSSASVNLCSPSEISSSDFEQVDVFMDRIRKGLLDASVIYESIDDQIKAETFSDLASYYCLTLSHETACRLYATGKVPYDLRAKFLELYSMLGTGKHKRLPLVFTGHVLWNILVTLTCTPIIAIAFIINIIPCALAYAAALKMADDDNVISLWKILVGFSLLLLQTAIYIPILLLLFNTIQALGLFILYTALTIAGIKMFYFWKCQLIKTFNHFTLPRREVLNLIEGIRKWQKTLPLKSNR